MLVSKDRLFYLAVAIGGGLVLYLSWRAHPQMAAVWFVPRWLAAWADENRNDTIRTAVPLVALGGLVGSWLAGQNRPWGHWLGAWAALAALVVLAEVGQLFLSSRSFDLSDIGWGSAGALLGLALVAAGKHLYLLLPGRE